MWLCEKSYYIENEEYNGGLAISSSKSMPIKAVFKDNKLKDVIYVNTENEFVSSVKKIFPEIIEAQVISFNNEKNINELFSEIEMKKNIYYNYLNIDMNKITINDLEYNDLIFSIEYNSKCAIPVLLNVYNNNTYKLYTEYKSCKPGETCNLMLQYINFIEGKYEYDIIEIIRRTKDANYDEYNNENEPEYKISSGKGHQFVTNKDNRYLQEFIKLINVDLSQCAKPHYKD